MQLTVTSRQPGLVDATRSHLSKKLKRLERMLNDNAVSAQCIVSEERQRFICELTLHAREDHVLHAVGRDSTLARAIAGAVEKLEQQARKLTDRWKTRGRRGESRSVRVAPPTTRATAAPSAPEGAPAPRRPRVIRMRTSAAKPMTADDAALALAGSGDAVLVFRDAESNAVSVLYRRPDGHFGLIEPED
jgi:putative sigma-54 modulation protein